MCIQRKLDDFQRSWQQRHPAAGNDLTRMNERLQEVYKYVEAVFVIMRCVRLEYYHIWRITFPRRDVKLPTCFSMCMNLIWNVDHPYTSFYVTNVLKRSWNVTCCKRDDYSFDVGDRQFLIWRLIVSITWLSALLDCQQYLIVSIKLLFKLENRNHELSRTNVV